MMTVFIIGFILVLLIYSFITAYKFNKFKKSLKVGNIYKMEQNPFNIKTYHVLEIKNGYVRYYVSQSNGVYYDRSCSIDNFWNIYLDQRF